MFIALFIWPNTYHDPDKKRRTLPVEKKALEEKLKYRTASAVRNELLDAAMDVPGWPKPAHVLGLNATRITKCRENCDGRSSGGAIQSLYDMKDRFVNSIQNIGLDPFHVFLKQYPKEHGIRKKQRELEQQSRSMRQVPDCSRRTRTIRICSSI